MFFFNTANFFLFFLIFPVFLGLESMKFLSKYFQLNVFYLPKINMNLKNR